MASSTPTYSDDELYRQLSSPKTKHHAFAELYERHAQRVWVYCRRIIGTEHTAEDIFQETFLRLLSASEHGVIVRNIPAYLLRIARNLCLNEQSKLKPEYIDIADLGLHAVQSDYESKELAAVIETALDLLPKEHQEAFILQLYSGMSYSEIAEIQDVPLTTVRNRIVRAKKKLADILNKYLTDYSEKS